MKPIEISGVVLACTFVGSLCGVLLRTALPETHLTAEAKDLIKMAMGLIGTMTALVLGLLIASASASYNAKRSELTEISSDVVLLDQDRHRKVDIPELMAQSKQALAEVRGDTLYDRLRLLNSETQQILQEAKQSKNPDLALRAINRIERQLELEAKLLGQLDESAKIAIGINNARPAQESKLDLSVLTDDEFDELKRLYRKAGADV